MDWEGAWGERSEQHVLISAFFERLPHFIALKRLHAKQIRLTHTEIANMCELPALTFITVSGWTTATREDMGPALTLRVASFTATHDYRMSDIWFFLFSRDTLLELDLYQPLALANSEVESFPNVHTLRIERFSDTTSTVAAFNKLSNLRSFSSPYGDVFSDLTPAQESSLFPVLKEYTGAHLNLRIFGQRTTLTHITLVSSPTFADFITELQGVTALPNIIFLAVPFLSSAQNTFGKAEFETLLSFFPNLAELRLTLDPTEHGELLTRRMTLFLEMLPSSPLPSTLHSLSLNWRFHNYNIDRRMVPSLLPADMPDFAVLRAELIAKCPALACIFLDGYHFLFLWKKTSSVWEATAYTHSDAEIIRGQLERNT
ncbi:hypothetical protein C8R45DRAFT_995568 [Mycena sanguinolenta]|nr:hypothetical protein C8R45DRAFT_995568 [Mycena sanguinolenta]